MLFLNKKFHHLEIDFKFETLIIIVHQQYPVHKSRHLLGVFGHKVLVIRHGVNFHPAGSIVQLFHGLQRLREWRQRQTQQSPQRLLGGRAVLVVQVHEVFGVVDGVRGLVAGQLGTQGMLDGVDAPHGLGEISVN